MKIDKCLVYFKGMLFAMGDNPTQIYDSVNRSSRNGCMMKNTLILAIVR
jgi:hypothetical protein